MPPRFPALWLSVLLAGSVQAAFPRTGVYAPFQPWTGDTHGGGGAYTAFLPGTSMPLALDRPGPGDTTWAYDQERRLDSLATGGFGFDLQYNAGGLISRVIPSTGTSTAFSYNARRELTGADGPQAFAYAYDGSGNRVSASLPIAALGGSGNVQVSLVYQPDALHGYQAVGSATSGTPESLHLVRVQGTINRTVPVRLQVRADGDLVFDQLLPPHPEHLFEVEIPLRNLAATARTVTLAVTGILPGGAANGRDAVARLDETVLLPALDVLARGGIEDRAYDADGNLTSDGTWTYAWNGRNQLAAMERPGESLAFEYNAEGMRTFKRHRHTDAEGAVTERSHRFVWDGAMLLVEEITETLPDTPPQTWHRTYTWGLDLSGSVGGAGGTGGLLSIHDSRLGQTVLPVSNHRGDVVALVSTTGATVAEWDFGPFGEPLPATGDPAWLDACRIGFGCKYTDPETGLVYFGFRYYDPRHGRWLGREPLGEEESFNPYAYCHNDPVNHYDYLGLETLSQLRSQIAEIEDQLTNGRLGPASDQSRLQWWWALGQLTGAERVQISAERSQLNSQLTGLRHRERILGMATGGLVLMDTMRILKGWETDDRILDDTNPDHVAAITEYAGLGEDAVRAWHSAVGLGGAGAGVAFPAGSFTSAAPGWARSMNQFVGRAGADLRSRIQYANEVTGLFGNPFRISDDAYALGAVARPFKTAGAFPNRLGGTGPLYDELGGQGLYILRNPKTGTIEYVGRGDAPSRLADHALPGSGKEDLVGTILWSNNLSFAQAVSLERELIHLLGGPKSLRRHTQLRNKIDSLSPGNPNFIDWEFLADDALVIETLKRAGLAK